MLENAPPSLLTSLSGLKFCEYLRHCESFRRFLLSRYSEIRLPPEIQDYFITYPDTVHWVIIAEEENPDSLVTLPILQRIVECSPRFFLYIFPSEAEYPFLDALIEDSDLPEDLADMDIPLLMLFDEDWSYQCYWGPRPAAADPFLEEWLENHPEYEDLVTDDSPENQENYLTLLTNLTAMMRIWYNSGLDGQCIKEIQELLVSIQEQNQLDDSYVSADDSQSTA